MTKVLTDRELLEARGWREVEERLWRRPDPENVNLVLAEPAASIQQRLSDGNDVHKHGSVTYRPTVEQARTSPLLTQLANEGATEREVIAWLFTAHEEQRRLLLRRADGDPTTARAVENAKREERARIIAAIRATAIATGAVTPQLEAAFEGLAEGLERGAAKLAGPT